MESNTGNKKILIVDDNEVHVAIAENYLQEKYETIAAKSGLEAINILCKGLMPDLILLDILMPEMDGWETYNKIRGISLLKNVPIVFITSLQGEKEKQYAARLGAADLITKPYDGDKFMETIEKSIK